jgi:SAM-dependent methyltransferase
VFFVFFVFFVLNVSFSVTADLLASARRFRLRWAPVSGIWQKLGIGRGAQGRATPVSSRPSLVERYFWIVLWRAPHEWERRESTRAAEDGQSLAGRLFASTEFRNLYKRVRDKPVEADRLAQLEPSLQKLGTDAEFMDEAYETLLGRPVDDSGRWFYSSALAAGQTRTSVLVAILQSAELADRHRALSPVEGLIPRDIQLCELVNPAKWDNPDWLAQLTSLAVVPPDKTCMHRKGYELTQLIFGLTRLGHVRPETRVLSVGAGHEPVLYWLANRVRKVVATDLYSGFWEREGAMEGDSGVLTDPASWAPFRYRQERLVFTRMAGQTLGFRDRTFDVVYSLSSIEHFGGLPAAKAAVAEMARVLVPGGILALATDYCLDGTRHFEAFAPDEVHELIRHPDLRLVQPIDEGVWQRYQYEAVDMALNPRLTPHLVVLDRGALFTSVMVFLERVGT